MYRVGWSQRSTSPLVDLEKQELCLQDHSIDGIDYGEAVWAQWEARDAGGWESPSHPAGVRPISADLSACSSRTGRMRPRPRLLGWPVRPTVECMTPVVADGAAVRTWRSSPSRNWRCAPLGGSGDQRGPESGEPFKQDHPCGKLPHGPSCSGSESTSTVIDSTCIARFEPLNWSQFRNFLSSSPTRPTRSTSHVSCGFRIPIF